jgi:hypothetical protein
MPSNMPQGDLDVRDDPFATSRERARPPRQTIMGDEFAEVPQPLAKQPSLERALTIAECAALVDAEAAILARGGVANDASVQALEQAADKIRGLK